MPTVHTGQRSTIVKMADGEQSTSPDITDENLRQCTNGFAEYVQVDITDEVN